MIRRAAREIVDTIAAAGERRGDLIVTRHEILHRCGRYEIPRVASRGLDDARDRRPVVLLQAVLHGDEIAGPLGLVRDLDAIAARVHSRGLALLAYPLVNPSGFDAGTRYNGDRDRGAGGNGDFLRYVREDGTLADEVPPSDPSPVWRWSGEEGLGIALPAETRLMQALLRRDPLDRVAAAADLHQDHLTPGVGPAAYAYAYGDTAVYRGIADRVRALVPLLANVTIGAGYGVEIGPNGETVRPCDDGPHPASDSDGILVRHDGSLTDLLHRIGVRFSVAVETTGAVPLGVACDVNRIWIEGLIDLASSAGA